MLRISVILAVTALTGALQLPTALGAPSRAFKRIAAGFRPEDAGSGERLMLAAAGGPPPPPPPANWWDFGRPERPEPPYLPLSMMLCALTVGGGWYHSEQPVLSSVRLSVRLQ